MSTMIVTTRITHKYLMSKTKWELASWLMDSLDEVDKLRDALEEIHRLPLAPETRPDLPYSLLSNIDHIAKEALGIKPEPPEKVSE